MRPGARAERVSARPSRTGWCSWVRPACVTERIITVGDQDYPCGSRRARQRIPVPTERNEVSPARVQIRLAAGGRRPLPDEIRVAGWLPGDARRDVAPETQ